MKLSKLLTSIAVAVTLLGSGATVLSTNTNVQAAKKSSKDTKINGFYKNKWPTDVAMGKRAGFVSDYYQSDDKKATYLRFAYVFDSNYNVLAYKLYYDANHQYLSKTSFYLKLHVPYLKFSGNRVILASNPSMNAKTMLIYNTKQNNKKGIYPYLVTFKKYKGTTIKESEYCHFYTSGKALDTATNMPSNVIL